MVLAKQFSSPHDAHLYYTTPKRRNQPVPQRVKLHIQSSSTQTNDVESIIDLTISLMASLPDEKKYYFINKVIQVLAARTTSSVSVPDDFVKLSLAAMERLKQCGRHNIVYGLVHGLGIMREDKSDSRLPALRMPMGLLEYVINFYLSSIC